MKLLVRADGDAHIGSGHVMRCLALAEAWRKRGPVVWHAERLADPLRRRIQGAGIRLTDAADWATALASERPAAAVVDGYGFDARDVAAAKAAGAAVLRIDDRGQNGPQGADLLLDATFGAGEDPGRVKALLGPRYALLRPTADAPAPLPVQQPPEVLVTLGSTAPPGLVRRTLRAVTAAGATGTLVLGGLQEEAEALAREAEAAGWKALQDVDDLRPLIDAHGLVVCPASTTLLEVASRCRPAVVLAFVDNQRAPLRDVERLGVAGVVADAPPTDRALQNTLATAVGDASLRQAWARQAGRLVDGRGARRVTTHLAAACLDVRTANDGDRDRVLEWANDPVTRAMSFHPEPISEEQHRDWWQRRMEDPASFLYIVEEHAFVWFRLEGDTATISVNVAPRHRGHGFGAAVIRAGVDRLFADTSASRVRALVRSTNPASRVAFLDADLDQVDLDQVEAVPADVEEAGERPWVFMAHRRRP